MHGLSRVKVRGDGVRNSPFKKYEFKAFSELFYFF